MVRQLAAPEDLDTPRTLPGRSPVPERVTAVAATADLGTVAVATATPWFPDLVEVLILTGETVLRRTLPSRPRVLDLVFDADGSALTAVESLSSVHRWTLDGPGERWSSPLHDGFSDTELDLAQVAVDDGGRFFAATSARSQNAVVWDASTGHEMHNVRELYRDLGHAGREASQGAIALSPDGSTVAFTRADGYSGKTGIVIQALGGRESSTLVPRTGVPLVGGLAFAPDGAALVAVGSHADERVATVIDLTAPGNILEPVVLPTQQPARWISLRPVFCGAQPRAALVDHGRVTVWDLTTGRALASLPMPGPGGAAALTPDGRGLLIAAPDLGVHAHTLP